MSIYGLIGDGNLSSYSCGQGFYRRKEDQSWILDYTITRNVNSLVIVCLKPLVNCNTVHILYVCSNVLNDNIVSQGLFCRNMS